ncbi:MAG: pantoate--beta-alanine ligase [Ignavibacteriaceae bacterium]|nr:pantoate--beta-alanine ligase [Ignavibacteriaceae bacterium]
MTQIIKTVKEWRELCDSENISSKELGFIPTMGALHKGHASLIKKCVSENRRTVVSIFVNPTQFNDPNDLKKYPKTFEQDFKMLEELKVDYLFFPNYEELYPDNFTYKVHENSLSKILCGAYRSGHFDGVLTVVMKLLNSIKPGRAYFGEKDYQQYKLIKGIVEAFFLQTEIIACPTVRDEDGLALSSRNLLLSPEERKLALNFPGLLKANKTCDEIKFELEKVGFKVDYIEEYDGRRLGAVYAGKVRLIDNVKL